MPTWHILTGEYPPQRGGVADYTAGVAASLLEAGDAVHVWTGGSTGTAGGPVPVHRVFGDFSRHGIAAGARLLDAQAGGGRLLVEWVPHAFGARGVNVLLPLWLYRRRTRRPEPVDVMVHEPFVPFAGSAAQHAAAAAQRVMTGLVLRAASRAFVGTPAWADFCQPFAPRTTFAWSPVPSGIPVAVHDRQEARRRLDLPPDRPVIGSFGRGGAFQAAALRALAGRLRDGGAGVTLLLIGLGSDRLAAQLGADGWPDACDIRATGTTDAGAVSAALRACDVMIQGYPDGICARHSSAAAVLAHELPMVANEGRFTEPLWRESGGARLVPSTDPAAMAEAAAALLRDGGARAALASAAGRLYDTRFHVRHTVAALRN